MTYGQYRYLAHVTHDQPGGMHSQRSMTECFDLGFLDDDGLTGFGAAEYAKAKASPPAPPPVRSRQL
ncbi:hypothetical protein [Brevundimonas sp.]|uniref:hypothetical protein n=1 Tax=Brevundimonas sp. TaxID=1871086 RepID=UPI002FCB619D